MFAATARALPRHGSRSCNTRGRRLAIERLEQRCLLSVDPVAIAGNAGGLNTLDSSPGRRISDFAYAAAADFASTPTNAGLVMVFDKGAGEWIPVSYPLSDPQQGFSGLAFNLDSLDLFGSTISGPGSPSKLAVIDPQTGRLKSLVEVKEGLTPIRINDLAVHPGTGDLYGIGEGKLFQIDPQSGAASSPRSVPLEDGLAIAREGDSYTFYITGIEAGQAQPLLGWFKLEAPADPYQQRPLTGALSNIVALAWNPTRDNLWGAEASYGLLYEIDPGDGSCTSVPASPNRGIAGDLTFPLTPPPYAVNLVYEEDFEDGSGGYVADNSGGSQAGLWHFSIGRRDDDLVNHTPYHSWYYGAFEGPTGGGHYVTRTDHQGVLISPTIKIPDDGTTLGSFSYLLQTREPLDCDFVDVFVKDGASVTRVLTRLDGTLRQTGHQWLTATANLTPFAGKSIQLRFSFDTGDMPQIDPEGWYVDDVTIVNIATPQPDISGYKWDDRNHDGVWDAGKPGLPEWRIYLDNNNNDHLDLDERSAVTDSNGFYSFVGLAPDTYTVREVLQEGWKQSYPDELLPGVPPFEHQVTIDPPDGLRVAGHSGVTEPPNFGNFITDISGYKWDDRNRDGVWDVDGADDAIGTADDEPGLNGWTIYLDLNNDNQWDHGVAGVPDEPSFVTRYDGEHDGAFWFVDLSAGTYTVREVYQQGWKQSYPGAPDYEHSVTIDPPSGRREHGAWGNAEKPNFGNFITDISGYKWDDLNRDGHWDAGEPGLNDWTIYLDLNNDNQPSPGDPSFVTRYDGQHDGAFWFVDVPAGTHAVGEMLQEGWQQVYPDTTHFTHLVTIDPPHGLRCVGDWEAAEKPNFGNSESQPAEIRGYKWHDLNGNGEWDEQSESGLKDWTIYIDQNDNDLFDPDEPHDVTPDDGSYRIDGLEAGTHTVREVLQDGWRQSYPRDPDEHHVTVVAGQVFQGRPERSEPPNFGNYQVATISGYKWEDMNADGQWDADGLDDLAGTDDDEKGVSGWKIYLGNSSVPAVTDAEGKYTFDNLDPETYVVREDLPGSPERWEQSYPGRPGLVHFVTVTSGQLFEGRKGVAEPPNFGNYRPGGIRGFKWDDKDKDGDWDTGEPGLNGWTIYLDLNTSKTYDVGEPAAVTANDGTNNGAYAFLDLKPGTYTVREILDGVEQTYPGPPDFEHVVTVLSGQIVQGHFGEKEPPNFGNWIVPKDQIRGFKWHDWNGNGDWDTGEPGLNGWTIYLDKNNDGMPSVGEPATVTANDGTNNGAYAFLDVEPGTYVVREIVLDGWEQTYPGPPDFKHVVIVTSGGVAQGDFGKKQAPNFGNYGPLDWGDAPDSSVGSKHYPTRKGDNGPRHRVVDGFYLGYAIDAESDGQPDSQALGDDRPTGDDEDGVEFATALVPGQLAEIKVRVTKPQDKNARLDAWIDFNGDGDWLDAGEQIAAAQPLSAGDNTVTIFVPAVATKGETFARFRLSSQGGLPPTGRAPDGEVEDHKVLIGGVDTSVVQFTTPLSLFRLDGFEEPEPPGSGGVSIEGYKWSDENHDGNWDSGEPGMRGWRVYLDRNDNDEWDAQSEPSAVTGEDGRFFFAGLDPGTYTIRELVPFAIESFPANPHEHTVQVDPQGAPVKGHFEVNEPPNFGGFNYSPFVRPADNRPGDSNPLGGWITYYAPGESEASKKEKLLKALAWQSFSVGNPTNADFRITGVKKEIAYPGDEFVSLFVVDEKWPRPPNFPMTVKAGSNVQFFASYRPTIPDWQATSLTPHEFQRDDRLTIITDLNGETTLGVRLVGASTYDSDITYDGIVNDRDVRRLDDILLKDWPTKPIHSGWDPTSDINCVFANGALEVPEIGLGDFGPLNVEYGRTRSPFLDLDWNNSAGTRGVDCSKEFVMGSLKIDLTDDDSRFANFPLIPLESVVVTLTNPADESDEQLYLDNQPKDHQFAISGLGAIENYNTILRPGRIQYDDQKPSPRPGSRVVTFESRFSDGTLGNTARTVVTIKPGASLAAAVASLGSAQTDGVMDTVLEEEASASATEPSWSGDLLDAIAFLSLQDRRDAERHELKPRAEDLVFAAGAWD